MTALAGFVSAQTLALNGDIQRSVSLTNTTVTMTGRSELHLSATVNPMPGCTIHLNSPDAWFFMTSIRPSVVNSTYLGQLRVNGVAAVQGTNVRIVQYGLGAVVIPQPPSFQPFEGFAGRNFSGTSKSFGLYTYYDSAADLGAMHRNLSSFRLKRGYMATVSIQASGNGVAQNYVAQDGDLEVPVLPANLDNAIQYIRVFPWRWTSKKGTCDTNPNDFAASWNYNWNNDGDVQQSTLDVEFVPIKQQRWWPAFPTNKPESIHLLGYNEPDNPVEDAYESLDNGNVDTAIAVWDGLEWCGLRLGSPAVTDGGKAWLYDFMNKTVAANRRVDFIAIHNYQCGNSATSLHNWLKDVYDRYGKPIWLTEFNNGANWTGCGDPTFEQNATAISSFIDRMDNTPWIERYSIYSNVEEVRQLWYNGGGRTPTGAVYQANASPIGYVQAMPESEMTSRAIYPFDGTAADNSGSGQPLMVVGTPSFPTGKNGQALSLDGANDYLQLSSRIGDSTDFTFAGWVKWNGGADWQRIFDFGNYNLRSMFITPAVAGKLRFNIFNETTEQILEVAGTLPVGVWTHVGVTIAGNTGKLFVNGLPVATNAAMTLNPVDLGTKHNFLGKSQFPADPTFNGQLDDIMILPYALTDAQVALVPNNRLPQFSSSEIVIADALRNQPFAASFASTATDADAQALIFSKVSGPAWLAVAANGTLTGVPTSQADLGENTCFVTVTDTLGGSASAMLKIRVVDPPGFTSRYTFNSTTNAAVGTSHGVATGAPTYVGSPAPRSAAIVLDGVDDFVTLPAGVANHDEITIATWVWWNGGNIWQRIFDFGNSTADNMFLTPRSGANTLRFAVATGGIERILETTQLGAGGWHHVAVTLGGGTGKLYLNGLLKDTEAITFKPSDMRPAVNYLGKSQWPDPLFAGQLDEFVILNRALDANGIAALYTATNLPLFVTDPFSKPATTVGADYGTTISATGSNLTYSKAGGPRWLSVAPNGTASGIPSHADAGTNYFTVRATNSNGYSDDATMTVTVAPPSDLHAHYQFHNAVTDSDNGFNGAVTGAPAYTPGIFDQAVDLDATDDFVTLPAAAVNSLGDVTIATRFRWDGGNAWQRIFDFGKDNTAYLFFSPSYGANLRFGIKNGGAEQVINAPAAPIGEWTHAAVTLIGNTGTIYINGAAVATGPITIDPVNIAPTLNYLGKSQYAADPLFNGAIDDLRIFNRGLTASEVAALVAPRSAYDTWTTVNPFPAGQGLPGLDPDRDQLANMFEFLLGSDPLVPSLNVLPQAQTRTAAEIGLPGNKLYLTLTARLRVNREGHTVTAEAAASPAGLALPAAATHAILAGLPVDDGAFEIVTWYYDVAIEDGGVGFMRLRGKQE